MIVTLEFELPQERMEYEEAINANKYVAAIHEIMCKLRSIHKYKKLKTKEAKKLIEEIYVEACIEANGLW